MNVIPLILLSFSMAASPQTKAGPRVLTSILKSPKQSEVSPALICRVKEAIRFRGKPWDDKTCEALSSAFSKGREKGIPPILTFSMTINESDLREASQSQVYMTKRGGTLYKATDYGLMGIQCLQTPTLADLRAHKAHRKLSPLRDNGACANGYAKGITPSQLKDPTTNVRIGIEILNKKRKLGGAKWISHYNGDLSGGYDGYAGRITAIAAACNGVQLHVETKRMKMLTHQIIQVARSMKSEPVALSLR